MVRRRRMVRRYDDRPLPEGFVDRALANAVRAPSAGFTQGWAFVVLSEPEQVARFWAVTAEPGARSAWLAGMRTAPVIVIPLACREAYLDRYAAPDKGWADRSPDRWPVPYWYLDSAMAALLILQTAVDEGLGGCFFGIPGDRVQAFRAEFGIPADHEPIGAITLGHPAAGGSPGSPSRRARRALAEVVHHGGW